MRHLKCFRHARLTDAQDYLMLPNYLKVSPESDSEE
jgi:hypothetical protein